ncbi:Fructose biphosphate aldolase B [Spraguea lophii 42_110]|uniref:fructose-bisphosphate aldolase n=1 Tax=Spraguea lophii (strain 42_110) TaxID=1358809 RepID=S7XV21_SPRLO|nr:Fructose biphosphate aldolase B [Spraguea lophii 42_110]
MDNEKLFKLGTIAEGIITEGKGILALDETAKSMEKKFKKYEIENSLENRNNLRECLITTPGISSKIGGVILNEETFNTKMSDGTYLTKYLKDNGIYVGIKLDKGLIDFNENEKISVGLEDLRERIKLPVFRSASFAKWRSLIYLSDENSTDKCIAENCRILAEYSKICQENGIVPIVEPELFFDGKFTIEKSYFVMKKMLSQLIYELNLQNIYIPGLLLKASFVSGSPDKTFTAQEVAQETLNAFLSSIPCGIPGIVFLSGGHSSNKSIEYLNHINNLKGKRTWKLSFSFGRALTDEAIKEWNGGKGNYNKAQEIFKKTVDNCHKASLGKLEIQTDKK